MKEKKKPVTVKINELQVNFYARKALDQDHILFLATLIDNGVKLPPITITADKKVVDGRHRIEANLLNNLTEIEAEITATENEVELIGQAYRSNLGGSLPPTAQDTEHTIILLLDRNESIKRIAELLGLPPGMTRNYVNTVKSKIAHAKMVRAVEAVTDGGLSVTKAAENHGVDVDKLKEKLSGRTKKATNGVAEIQRNLTSTYRSHSQKNATMMRKLIAMHEDGDVRTKQVRDIIAHVKKLQERSTRVIMDWESRFEAVNKKS